MQFFCPFCISHICKIVNNAMHVSCLQAACIHTVIYSRLFQCFKKKKLYFLINNLSLEVNDILGDLFIFSHHTHIFVLTYFPL